MGARTGASFFGRYVKDNKTSLGDCMSDNNIADNNITDGLDRRKMEIEMDNKQYFYIQLSIVHAIVYLFVWYWEWPAGQPYLDMLQVPECVR
jgi:hypothetical protein